MTEFRLTLSRVDVFGKMKYQATGFFFQFYTNNILAFKWVGMKVKYTLNCDNDGDYVYENKLACEGIILKNKVMGIDGSFGFLIRGPNWQYHPTWYQDIFSTHFVLCY